MRTDETDQPNFWEREDIQLRFEQAAVKMAKAVVVAKQINDRVPEKLKPEFTKSVDELEQLKRRCLAYSYHLRETNLSDIMRNDLKNGLQLKSENIAEMQQLLTDDQKNQGVEEPIGTAVKLLNSNVHKFLSTYFLPSQPTGDKNGWTITSQ